MKRLLLLPLFFSFAIAGSLIPVAQASIPQAAPTIAVPPVPQSFQHPGLLSNLDELHAIRQKIEAGQEPWKTAFANMKASKWAALDYQPHPHENVSSGFLGKGGGPGGAYDEADDAIAAYTQALMWIFTGDERYAQNATRILNAWTILKEHAGPNWSMMAEWEGAMFPQGAELLRATYPGWSKADIAKFSDMLNRVFLPVLHNRMLYGNREFGAIDAMMAIGVFNNDRAAFAEGMAHWVSYVPAWIYLKKDGPSPVPADYWKTTPSDDQLAALDTGLFPDVKISWIYSENRMQAFMKDKHVGDDHTGLERGDLAQLWNHAPAAAFVDGLCGETFRDLGHCDLGFGETIQAAEIAWHQGIDLYSIHAARLTAFMELQSSLRTAAALPPALATVKVTGTNATYEIAYNHYHNRLGLDLPETRQFLERAIRPCLQQKPKVTPGWSSVATPPGIRSPGISYPADLNNGWDTLTHAELGGGKTPPKS